MRADLLRRAVASLGIGQRTNVVNDDVAVVASELPNAFDVVTARSFGDVAVTTRFIDMLLAEDGVGLVSEPPTDREATWAAALAEYPALFDDGVYQGIRRLIRG